MGQKTIGIGGFRPQSGVTGSANFLLGYLPKDFLKPDKL